MKMNRVTRRQFIRQSSTLVTTAALLPSLIAEAVSPVAKRTAVDMVPLGKKGVQICRLGFGTGSQGGSIQRALGQDSFTRLFRYAYDHGITYIDTADNYKTHPMVREAIKGLPREKLFIQTKMPGIPEKPLEVLERYRKELGVEYLDCVLTHCVTTNNWHEERKRVMDALQEAQEKKIIRLKGVSCHGLPGLTRATEVDWVDVHLVRVNPQCVRVDGPSSNWNASGHDLAPVMKEIKAMHAKGRGIIGMKIIGNGEFVTAADRDKSIRFAMAQNEVNAVVMGFKSSAEIDEALERMNRALRES